MKRMIIDIRNNAGRYGNISQCIASLFVDVEMAPEEAYLTGNSFGSFRKPRKVGKALWSDIPIAVIVNVSTCSAGSRP